MRTSTEEDDAPLADCPTAANHAERGRDQRSRKGAVAVGLTGRAGGTVASGDHGACRNVGGGGILQIASWSSSNAVANPKGVPPVWLTSLAGVAAEIYSVAVSTETATPAILRMSRVGLS